MNSKKVLIRDMDEQTKQEQLHKRRASSPLMPWLLFTALVLGLGALVAYVITRDSTVLSWATGMLGTTFGATASSIIQPKTDD